MSDFDTVLERLLDDPSFASALAADPGGALAGYRLSADETALLRSQVTGDQGGQSAVETRANQSSTFGLLTPLAGLAGAAEMFGHVSGVHQGFAAPGATQGLGAAQGAGVTQGFGAAQGAGVTQGFGVAQGAGATQGFGAAHGAGATQGFGAAHGAGATQGFGAAPAPTQGFGSADSTAPYTAGFGSTDQPSGIGGGLGDDIGRAVNQERPPAAVPQPPEGYHTRVDVDGDGDWDRHRLRGTRDGGVDILVDANRDGRVDFIGHDRDADGLVDSAQYDKDHDGFFERRSYDDNGDGWLDRHQTRRPPAPPPPTDGGMIGRNLPLPDEG